MITYYKNGLEEVENIMRTKEKIVLSVVIPLMKNYGRSWMSILVKNQKNLEKR